MYLVCRYTDSIPSHSQRAAAPKCLTVAHCPLDWPCQLLSIIFNPAFYLRTPGPPFRAVASCQLVFKGFLAFWWICLCLDGAEEEVGNGQAVAAPPSYPVLAPGYPWSDLSVIWMVLQPLFAPSLTFSSTLHSFLHSLRH